MSVVAQSQSCSPDGLDMRQTPRYTVLCFAGSVSTSLCVALEREKSVYRRHVGASSSTRPIVAAAEKEDRTAATDRGPYNPPI